MDILERREAFFKDMDFTDENGEFDLEAFEAHEEAFRDTLSAEELERVILTEELAIRLIKKRNARGNEECAACCLEAGQIIAELYSEEKPRYML